MAPSLNFSSRKRKHKSFSSTSSSDSNPYLGTLTRSKAQIHFHRSRSGRAWPARNPFQQKAQLRIHNFVENPRKMHPRAVGMEASSSLSVKNGVRALTRVRASPILSCDCVSEVRDNVGVQIGEKGFSSGRVESDGCSDLGINGLDSGLNTQDLEPVSNDSDPGSVIENVVLLDKKKEEQRASTIGKVHSLDRRNSPISRNKLGKVYKAPGSFSYRRLLPFLNEMAQKDSSNPCNSQTLTNLECNQPSVMTKCNAAELVYESRDFDCNEQLEDGAPQSNEIPVPLEGQGLEDPSNNFSRTDGHGEVLYAEEKNGVAKKVDDFTEDCVQTTPPDAAIFSKLDDDNRTPLGERQFPCLEIQIFGPKTSDSTYNEAANDSGKSQRSPSQKSDSIPKTKPFLNRCSRMRIFKTSSFSYRRLLPYLMDVAKNSSTATSTDHLSQFENDFLSYCEPIPSPSSGKDVSVDKMGHDVLHEKFHGVEQDLDVLASPMDASSAYIYPENRTPLDSCDDSAGGRNTATSEIATAKPDIQLTVQLEGPVRHGLETTMLHENGKSESSENLEKGFSSGVPVQNGDVEVTGCEVICSVETSNSTTECEILPISEILQHQPRNRSQLVERASLNNTLLPAIESDHQGRFNSSPTKGILKRNPRGCRGLCNCLNCSSFRLNAERAFEFSKNQLLDAEELAFSLVGELANLRNLLEKSADDGLDLAASKCNKLQVKEACRKALRTEEVVKERFSLLNEDLNIHSRQAPLLRPRVTFCEPVEENAIAKTDFPTSSRSGGEKRIRLSRYS